MADIVVIFDFDRTLIDGDSDNWVVTQMDLTNLFNRLLYTVPWNSLMDTMMKELHTQGKTTDDIAKCLSLCPLSPRIIAAIKSARSLGCDLRIISDANQFFIERILESHGLLGCFSQISTNPTSIDSEGRLRIFPYHDSSLPPHGCRLCPSNMCKGLVIDSIRASLQNERKRFIYVGDGKGDYCPSLRLGEGDFVLPRKNYPLWDRIRINPTLVKAAVHEWTNGEELEKNLLYLINTISAGEDIRGGNSNQLLSSDTSKISANDASNL